MKRLLSSLIVCSLVLNLFSTVVYADELKSGTKVVDVEADRNATKFITEDGTLYGTNGDGSVTKIADNVKKVDSKSIMEFDSTYLTNDNELFVVYSYEDSDLENYYEVQDLSTGIKDMAFSYDNEYVIKEDDSLYKWGVGYSFDYEDLIPDIEEEFIADDVKSVYTEDYGENVLFIKNDNSLWAYGEGFLYSYGGENPLTFIEPTKIMDNVKDAIFLYESMYVLDLNGNLFYVTIDDFNKDGTIKKQDVMEKNVKTVELVNDSYTDDMVFIIKNDNSLWTSGYSDSGALGLGEDVNITDGFEKVADDVADVSSSGTHTVFVGTNGKIYGMGSSYGGGLGKVELVEEQFFDENGFYEIMTGVKSADITDFESTAITEDNALWGFGENYNNVLVENGGAEVGAPTKIAENVSFGKYDADLEAVIYIMDDKEIYFRGMYSEIMDNLDSEIEDEAEEKLLVFGLDYLGMDSSNYKKYLVEDSEEYLELVEKLMSLSEEEYGAFETIIEEYYESLLAEYVQDSYGENAVMTSGEFYLTENNEVYQINFSGEDKKIAENFIYIEKMYNDVLFIIDEENNLKYAEIYDTEGHYVDVDYDYENVKADFGDDASWTWASHYSDKNGDSLLYIELKREKEKLDFKTVDIGKVKEIKADNVGYTGFGVVTLDGKYYDFYNESEYAYFNENGGLQGQVIIYKYDYEVLDYISPDDRYTLAELTKIDGIELEIEDDYVSVYKVDEEGYDYHFDSTEIYTKDEFIMLGDEFYTKELKAENVKTFAKGYNFELYVDMNDVLWGMGQNYNGALGAGDEYYDEPKKIMEDVKAVYASNESALVLKNDGTLIGMGENVFGELGFEGQGESYEKYYVFSPIEVVFAR